MCGWVHACVTGERSFASLSFTEDVTGRVSGVTIVAPVEPEKRDAPAARVEDGVVAL